MPPGLCPNLSLTLTYLSSFAIGSRAQERNAIIVCFKFAGDYSIKASLIKFGVNRYTGIMWVIWR